jgi:hypothetical protein
MRKFEVTTSVHDMPSLEVKNPTEEEAKKLHGLIACSWTDDVRYQLRNEAGAFLQSDHFDYILIEFWKPTYQNLMDWLNQQ